MITARHLRQIQVIAETGAINRAAAVLNLSQPALTASIAKLEDRLGVQFFDRSARGAVPTVFGQHVIENADQILERLRKIERDLELLASGTRGQIRLMAGPVLIHGILRQVIPAFSAQFPNIHLHVQTGTAQDIVQQVDTGQVDLGLATMAEDPSLPLETMLLHSEDYAFAARPGHALTGKAAVHRAEVWTYPLATPEIPTQLQSWYDDRSTGSGAAQVCLETNDYELIIRTLLAGDALTAAPRHLLAPYFKDGTLAPIAFADPVPVWQAVAVFHRAQRAAPSFRALLDSLSQSFADHS